MEHIKSHLLNSFQLDSNIIGLLAVKNPYPYNPLIDGLDLLALVVVEKSGVDDGFGHVQIAGERVLVRRIDAKQLEELLYVTGKNRNIVEWLVRGDVLLDRDHNIRELKERLLVFPHKMREQKQLVEFSGFLRTYLQAKQDVLDGSLLDAHSHVLSALHHWAHIVLIEEGKHPEPKVWKQMRTIHPGIYKLYEELAASPETLEQRVQLVMLACEFTVMNKMKSCCALLFQIVGSRDEPWSLAELQNHEAINVLDIDLSLIVQNLVKRAYLREVAVMEQGYDDGTVDLRYMVGE